MLPSLLVLAFSSSVWKREIRGLWGEVLRSSEISGATIRGVVKWRQSCSEKMGMIFYFLSFLSFGLFRLLPLLLLLFLPCLQVSGAHHDGWTGRWRAVMSTTHSIELGQFQKSIGLNESSERALSLSQSFNRLHSLCF